MFGAVFAAGGSAADLVIATAQEFSPRLEVCSAREIIIDLAGLTRLFGSARDIAQEIRREAAERGLHVRVAIAATRTAARLIVHHRAGIAVIESGNEAETLASLPIDLLAVLASDANAPNVPNVPNDLLRTLRRWGLTTLGELAALPAAEVAARLGRSGVAWQRLARGEDPRPLQPAVPEERFEQALDLEWPIEGLEPLSFVLGRLLDPLSAHLERRDRGAAVLHVRLQLVSRAADGSRARHQRSLELPTPIRDAKTLRALALLDLESHPPVAAIDRVEVAVDPTPGRIVQFSLLTRPLPSPEQLSTLTARLDALMGAGRSGSPIPIDSWQPGAFAMALFCPSPESAGQDSVSLSTPRTLPALPALALRRFRIPVPARVRLDAGKPVRVMTDRHALAGGAVETCAGPWRTSGNWWASEAGGNAARRADKGAWDRDEWDVTLNDGATYRVFRERETSAWFIEGIVD